MQETIDRLKKSRAGHGPRAPRVRSASAGGMLLVPALLLSQLLLTPASVEAQVAGGQVSGGGSASIETAGFPRAGEIRGNRVNIRTTPSTNARVIIQLPDRTPVIATGRNGDWVRFSLPPEVKVWISQSFLEAVPGDTRLRVRGNRVNLRATPGTKYREIGQVAAGALLRPTGHVDTISDPARGPWVEVDAPREASGWIFGKYIALDRALTPAEVGSFYRPAANPERDAARAVSPVAPTAQATPAVAKTPGEPTPASAGDAPSSLAFRFPSVGHEPLVEIYERINAVFVKPLEEWKFEPIVGELQELARTSEDAVVSRYALEWAGLIEKHWLPTQRKVEEITLRKNAADRAQQEAQAKEEESRLEKPPIPTPRENDFSAVGWVATLGKFRKVDGTHRLLNGNRLLFYLKSEQLKLDDYVDKRVGIRGVIQDQPPSAGAQLILVTSITVLSD